MKTKKTIVLPAGHKQPVTRRDFLALGLIQSAAFVTLPTVAEMLFASQARAADASCFPPVAQGLTPFITLSLAGGASLGANYVPLDQGGQLLPSYSELGLGKTSALPIEREFNNVPFAGNGISQFLVGLRETASAATRQKTAFVAGCVTLRDDNDGNKLCVNGLVSKAGLVGSLVPNLTNWGYFTGTRHNFSVLRPPVPLQAMNVADVINAIRPGYGALEHSKDKTKNAILKLISKLSEAQKNEILARTNGDVLYQGISCANQRNIDLSQSIPKGLDPSENSAFSTLWHIVPGDAQQREYSATFATIVYNALNGTTGPASLVLGGYDYHGGDRTEGQDKDREAGQAVGRMLESAALMGKKLFLYVNTDGACGTQPSDSSSAGWVTDRGTGGVAYMIAFDPAGRPNTNGHQVGHFTKNQVADPTHPLSGSAERMGAAVFANYLTFCKRQDLIAPLIGSSLGVPVNDAVRFA